MLLRVKNKNNSILFFDSFELDDRLEFQPFQCLLLSLISFFPRFSRGSKNNNNNSGLGRRIADVSGEIREGSFLFQQLSVLIQRFNAVLLHDCFVDEVAGHSS